MEDIELRFLERTEDVQGSGEAATCRRVRVLQWRKRFRTLGTALGPGWTWTEWEDVPLVIGL